MKKNHTSHVLGFYHEYDAYGCFSNWYKSPLTVAGIEFNCVEQYMMFHKTAVFGEYNTAQKILQSSDPMEIKNYGRSYIKNFDAEIWDIISYTIVKRAIRAKFTQNKELQNILLSTGNKLLAECAPNDGKWGIKVGMEDDSYLFVKNWKGKNYLGRILMEVREEIRSGKADFQDAFNLPPIPEWKMLPGELRQNPRYYSAIQAYLLPLNKQEKNDFLYSKSFDHLESEMRKHTSKFPIVGFFELKQEIYDLSR